MSKKILRLSLLLILCSVILSACTFNWPWKKKTAALNQEQAAAGEAATSSEAVYTKQLKKFADNNDLKNFLQNHSRADNFSVSNPSGAISGSPFLNYRADSYGASAPDIVKTVPGFSYVLARNDLVIAKTSPLSEAKVIGRLSFKARPQGIIVSGNNLLVYGLDSAISEQPFYKSIRRQNAYTFVKVYDLSDPGNPRLKRDLDFEGVYENARLAGDYVYFLTKTPGEYIDGEPLLPRVADSGEVLNPACDTDASHCFAPETYYFDIAYGSYSFINITAINLKDGSEALSGQVYLLDRNQDIYLALNDLYFTYRNFLDEYSLEQAGKRELIFPKLSSVDQDKIAKIDAAPDYILNSDEKKLKTGIILDNYFSSLPADERASLQSTIDDSIKQKIGGQADAAGKTSLYRFSLGGKIAYEAIGEVNGQLIDKYSIDENNGFLRLATAASQTSSTGNGSSADFYTNIYVLDRDLKPAGKLENLATTAAINAARFIGNRAYLSTANSSDPLYAINLSDSAAPAVLGAVKVPGIYSYLLPDDQNGNKLISFGKDAGSDSAAGKVGGGLKLSLFDLTDLQKPKELDNYIIGDNTSDSIALSDPLTFSYSYSDAKNLLMIPATLRDAGNLSFAGVLVFNLLDNHLVLKGKVDHSYGGHFTAGDSFGGFEYYDNTVKRSLYSGSSDDLIYSFSNKLLKINKLADLSSVKDLILTPGSDDYIITRTPDNAQNTASSTAASNLPVSSMASSSPSAPAPAPAPAPAQTGSSTIPAL